MPTKPATPKLDKRVALTKKANVSTPEHSELLQWLIANHEYIIGQYHFRDDEWCSNAMQAALEDFRAGCEAMKHGLVEEAGDEDCPPEHQALCKKRLEEMERIADQWCEPDFDRLKRPTVTEFSVQERTYSQNVNRRGNFEAKPEGFVDLQVISTLHVAPKFKFTDEGWKIDSTSQLRSLWRVRTDVFDSRSSFAEISIYPPEWEYDESAFCRSWFDVWSELPSLGDILQHLKVLDELNQLYNHPFGRGEKMSRTFLVVPEISQSMADIIENEGFTVISRQRIDAALSGVTGAPPSFRWA